CQVRQAELERDRAAVEEKARIVAQALHAPIAVSALRPDVLAAARALYRARKEEEAQRLSLAREWAAGLEQQRATLPARVIGHANLVAATAQAIATDEHFGPSTAAGRGFDLLVLEEAERVSEPDFAPLARRAERWLLVGDPCLAPAAPPPEKMQRKRDHPVPRVAALPLLPRLWERLHCDPRRLPYAWFMDKGRWCCRLRALTAEQR